MKKIILIPFLALMLPLAACDFQTLKDDVSAAVSISSTTVPPQDAYAAANAYDTAAVLATQYLIYCKSNLATLVCSSDNRRNVLKYGRAGRQVRNQVETYIVTNTSVPVAIYNSLKTATMNLNSTPITQVH